MRALSRQEAEHAIKVAMRETVDFIGPREEPLIRRGGAVVPQFNASLLELFIGVVADRAAAIGIDASRGDVKAEVVQGVGGAAELVAEQDLG